MKRTEHRTRSEINRMTSASDVVGVEQNKLDRLRHRLSFQRNTLSLASVFEPALIREVRGSIAELVVAVARQADVVNRACQELAAMQSGGGECKSLQRNDFLTVAPLETHTHGLRDKFVKGGVGSRNPCKTRVF